ncbi:DUF6371 domain-containing protein [Soonwooa sp.]|uniref:DUF6371 domain-containing protein n=1 Tax=Soonwooa sp. TaxID=1938592 RepID=UPI0028A91B28|nr:DUF6371 domain-containing protein [Soonwooa sp.]
MRNRRQIAPLCPCGESNRSGKFSPIDEADPTKGYCHKCNKSFYHNSEKVEFKNDIVIPDKPITFHSPKLLSNSKLIKSDCLRDFLHGVFEKSEVDKAFDLYHIGGIKERKDWTVFWQVDNDSNIRYGKAMLYNSDNGKRVKDNFSVVSTVHSILKIKDCNYKQCLFGLHLVNDNTKPIAIVESEKTALIMSLVDDTYLWLATGGYGGFNYEILEPIKSKNITAFPDVGETGWNDIASRLNTFGFSITVNKILESGIYPKGYDLADVVLEQLQFEKSKIKKKEYQSLTKEERLKIGLKIFNIEDLQKLSKRIASNWTDYREIIKKLISEGMTQDDAEDILDIMCIRNVLQVGDFAYKTN